MFAKEFLLKKNYELLSRIGEGTYATVYKAKRQSDSLTVAVKLINVFKMENKKIQNALNEIRIICAIDHPNVVGYHEAFLDQKNKDLYIIMEYVGGGDLNDRIRFLSRTGKHLPEKTIWRYSLQILQGLQALHQRKIIHRDIKPGNLFVSEDLETIKIGDLNVSKILRNKSMTATVVGTPYYLAPEIWKNDMYDYRCDVFSFGCVLFELTALKVPFRGNSIAELFKKIEYGKVPGLPGQYSKDLFEFICASLIKNFKKRPTVKKLLQHPSMARRRTQFRDLVFSEKRSSTKMLKQMRVHNLTDLSRVLPSLKSSRASSMKMLGIGGRSFDKGFNSKKKNFQNFSCMNNSKFDESYSIYSTYKSRVERVKKKLFDQKTVKASDKKNRSRKSVKLAKKDKVRQSSGYQARKNYLNLIKQQRLKREREEKQRQSRPDVNAKNTIEFEIDNINEFGSDEELIEIMDELGEPVKKTQEDRPRDKKKPRSKQVAKTRQSSKDSRKTLKTDKMVFEVDAEAKANVEANKRTTEKKTLISKRDIKLYRQSKTDTARETGYAEDSNLNNVNNKASIELGLANTKRVLECLSVQQKKQQLSSINLSPKESIYNSDKFENKRLVAKKKARKSSAKLKYSGVQSERKIGRVYQKQPGMKHPKRRPSSKNIRNSKSTQKLSRRKGGYGDKTRTNFPSISISKPQQESYRPMEEIPEQEQASDSQRRGGLGSQKQEKEEHRLKRETADRAEKLKKSAVSTYSSKFNSNKSRKNKKQTTTKVKLENKSSVLQKKKKASNRTVESSYLSKAKISKKPKNSSKRYLHKLTKTEKIKIKPQMPQKSLKYIDRTMKNRLEGTLNRQVKKKENRQSNKRGKNLSVSALIFSNNPKIEKRESSQKIEKIKAKPIDIERLKKPLDKKRLRGIAGRQTKTREISKKNIKPLLYVNKKSKNQSVYRKVDSWLNQGIHKGKILKKGQNKYMDLLEIKRMKQNLEKIQSKSRPQLYQGLYYKGRSKMN